MEEDKWVYVLFAVNIILIVVQGILVYRLWYVGNYSLTSTFGGDVPATISECYNLSLADTANCLVTYTKPIYKYRKNPDINRLSYDELVDQGGDCSDWSSYYAVLAEAMGYYVYTPTMRVNKTNWHQVAIMSGDEGFCLIDQVNYQCWRYAS